VSTEHSFSAVLKAASFHQGWVLAEQGREEEGLAIMREWIAVCKAHRRLARRERGQCERCDAPVTSGSVLCEAHQDAGASPAAAVSLEDRRKQLATQRGRCPICGKKVAVTDDVDRGAGGKGKVRGLVHRSCARLIGLLEEVGPEGLERIRRYVWPRN